MNKEKIGMYLCLSVGVAILIIIATPIAFAISPWAFAVLALLFLLGVYLAYPQK